MEEDDYFKQQMTIHGDHECIMVFVMHICHGKHQRWVGFGQLEVTCRQLEAKVKALAYLFTLRTLSVASQWTLCLAFVHGHPGCL